LIPLAMADVAGAAGEDDEQMTERDRRIVRSQLRDLMDNVRANEDEMVRGSSGADKFAECVQRVNDLGEQARASKKVREQVVDTEAFEVLTGIGVKVAKNLTPGVTEVSPYEFLARLKSAYGLSREVEDMRWAELGKTAAGFFRHAPTPGFMRGPLSAEPKKRKATQRRERKEKDPEVEETRPDQIGSSDAKEKHLTDQNMLAMRKVMKRVKTTTADKLVNNPNSFAQTIENAFTLAFMVKNGTAKMERTDPTKTDPIGMKVESRDQADPSEANASRQSNKQFVMRLDYQTWKKMTAANAGSEPLMPDRPKIQLGGGGGGGGAAAAAAAGRQPLHDVAPAPTGGAARLAGPAGAAGGGAGEATASGKRGAAAAQLPPRPPAVKKPKKTLAAPSKP